MIHMKCQDIFSLKNEMKKKKKRILSASVLPGSLILSLPLIQERQLKIVSLWQKNVHNTG